MSTPESPRVAVVVPCFNDGATLDETLESIQGQDEPVELVVVDDGSTDPATLETFDRLERDGITVIHQANAGLGAARMTGVAATSAPFILPVDADDVLLPGAVGALADTLAGRPDAAAAWGWYQRFGDETTLQRTAPTLDAWQITYMNELPASSLVRRSALEEVGGWHLAGGYEDWDVWMALAERGWTGVGIDRVIYRYRRQGIRLAHRAAAQHADRHDGLRTAHAALFAARRANWRRSSAPLALRLALPAIETVPGLSRHQRRMLGGVVSHLAHRRGVRALARRVREQRRLAAGR
jgi:glycosyltransferase involved in cell wall biosynthesis